MFQPLYAQGSGSIRGKILDIDTGDPLTGANVFVQNSSVGAASDLDGNFYIPTIPAGQQTLVISYIGYHKLSVDINVTANQTLEVDYELEAEVLPGQEVLVTAQAVGQIEAINQQLSSNTIKNVVSESRIQELPDFNAAETIGRLPGVSTQRSSGEGNKIVIRGLSPKYSIIAINRLELGATDTSNRSVDLTMITPTMLKAVEVFKAITPDMDGDALGGYVNMQLREAPSGLHTDILWQSGYTKFNDKYDNYKAVGQVSNRFFDNQLGVFFLGNIENITRSSDNFNATYGIRGTREVPIPVYVNTIGLNRHLDTRKRYGANLIMDYKLSNGSISLINFLSRLNSDYTDYTTTYNPGSQFIDYVIRDGDRNTDIVANALQGNYDFGLFSVDYSISNNYSRNSDPEVLAFTFRQETPVYRPLDSEGNILPETVVERTRFDTLNFENTWLYNAGDEKVDYKENRYASVLNLKLPFNLSGINTSGFFQIGGKYRFTKRRNDSNYEGARIFFGGERDLMNAIQDYFDPDLEQDNSSQERFYVRNFTNSDPETWSDFLENRWGDLRWAPQTDKLNGIITALDNTTIPRARELWYSGPVQLLVNDYSFEERYSGLYAMTELNLGPNLMIVGGVRYENDDTKFTGYQIHDSGARLTQTYRKVTSERNNHLLLPMVHLRYKIFEWLDIRYAYTQTLTRPDFIALSPAYFVQNDGAFVFNAGNPDLKPGESSNHDVVASLYNNEIGLFTAGGFYKKIDKLIWQTQYQLIANPIPGFKGISDFQGAATGARVQTWVNNRYNAEIYGAEFDWQTRFWYLPFPISGIVLNVNYTHIWSNTKYPQPLYLRSGTQFVFVDSFRVGRVIDQPADIINASFGYDYEGFSSRVSFIYWGEVIGYVGNLDVVDSRTTDYFRIDVAVRQKLPLEGLQIYLNLNNINERKDEATQKTASLPTNQQYYGFTADLGLRYSF
jgi:TonB-dependent receptor